MTFERKILVGLEDIKAISFECQGENCKYRITVSPDEPIELPANCPHGHRWISGEPQAMAIPPLLKFTKTLAQVRVLSTQKTLGYRILLEFDEPKTN
jgi:hypothetical protein